MSCVQVSRPCLLQSMAKTWPAFEKWGYKSTSETLVNTFGKQLVNVYIDDEPLPDYQGISFDDTYSTQLKYDTFMQKMSLSASGAVMLETNIPDALRADIILPEFYRQGSLKAIELRQG